MWASLKNLLLKHPALAYATLTLLIMAPLLVPGYILTLDMTVTPHIPMPTQVNAEYLWNVLLHGLDLILPSMLIQKVVLCLMFFLTGMSMYQLVVSLQKGSKRSLATIQLAAFFAGLVYVVNPFVYDRFMTGQYLVIYGLAMLPFFVRFYLDFLAAPSRRGALRVTAIIIVTSILSLHTLGMVAILALGLLTWQLWRRHKEAMWLRQMALWSTVIVAIVLAASSYWLMPLVTDRGSTAGLISSFGAADRAAFATAGDGWGLVGNVLSLHGFWTEGKYLYTSIQHAAPWWIVPMIGIWLLVLLGAYRSWRERRGLTLVIGTAAALATILAIGTAGTIFAPLNAWLFDTIPFFSGYREPQKFAMLILFAYAYFGACGLLAIVQGTGDRKHREQLQATVAAVFILPCLVTPLLLWGARGQLVPRHYPADWYSMNDHLKREAPDQKVLFLPWHLYMRYEFAGRIIASPADKFFAAPLVTSSDPELGGAKSFTNNHLQASIEKDILPAAERGGVDMGRSLHKLDIHYVLLAKEVSHQEYYYLDQQQDLQLVRETANLKLYEVLAK